MKYGLMGASVVTGLLWLSTMICGLWIRSQNLTGPERASSLSFHTAIGMVSVVVGLITLGLMVFWLVRH